MVCFYFCNVHLYKNLYSAITVATQQAIALITIKNKRKIKKLSVSVSTSVSFKKIKCILGS